MGHKTLAELTADPFLRTLEGRDDSQPLTIGLTAGFLIVSTTVLSQWRTAGKRPPDWYGKGKRIRYSLGELRRYVRGELETAARLHPLTPSATPSPPLEKTTATEQVRQIAGGDAVDVFGLNEPILRGGRRRKVNQDTFAQFLSMGAPDDEWVFVMVPSPFPGLGVCRPVDLIASLDMDLDTLLDAECEQLSLSAYAETMAAFMRQEQAGAAAARSGDLPPRGSGDPPYRERPKA
jgi:hypothetical protein